MRGGWIISVSWAVINSRRLLRTCATRTRNGPCGEIAIRLLKAKGRRMDTVFYPAGFPLTVQWQVLGGDPGDSLRDRHVRKVNGSPTDKTYILAMFIN